MAQQHSGKSNGLEFGRSQVQILDREIFPELFFLFFSVNFIDFLLKNNRCWDLVLKYILIPSKKSVLWSAIFGHLDEFSRPSIENKCVRICFLHYHFLQTKMAAKFWFVKGLYCVVLSYQSYVVQKGTKTQSIESIEIERFRCNS
jgi:hypothetical protein